MQRKGAYDRVSKIGLYLSKIGMEVSRNLQKTGKTRKMI
jgi:hypothetical protein